MTGDIGSAPTPESTAEDHQVGRPDGLSSAFISYSRKNSERVRRMHGALVGQGRDVWVDWEDILPSADWAAEIEDGIVQRDVIIVVLSPDWLSSAVCQTELEIAVRRGKRLVPVVIDPVEPTELPAEVTRPNWVFLRDGDDFAEAIASLTFALDIDFAHLRAHTRLGIRSAEWVAAGRNRSLVLHGSDLAAAETWLAGAAGKSPRVTGEQTEFIIASRAAATRRQRIFLGAAALAVVISTSLAILAYIQRETARSREAAALAEATLAFDPAKSLVLAQRALGAADTQEARSARDEALIRDHLLLPPIRAHRGPINEVAFSPDGRFVATASGGPVAGGTGDSAEAAVWDAESGENLCAMPHDGDVLAIGFGPEGRRLLTVSIDRVLEWDASCRLQARRQVHDAQITAWGIDSASRSVATADLDGVVQFSAAAGPGFRRTLPSRAGAVALAADGRLVAAGDLSGGVSIWRSNGREVARLSGHRLGVTALAFTPDGRWLVSGSHDGTVRFWPLVANTARVIVRRANRGRVLTVDAAGDRVIVGGSDGTLREYSARDAQLIATMPGHTGFVTRARFGPGAERVISASDEGVVRVWDAATGGERALLAGHLTTVLDAVLSPDGASAASGSYDGELRLWDADSGGSATQLVGHDSVVAQAAFDATGKRVITGSLDGTARLWDVETGRELRRYAHENLGVQRALITPDGRGVITASWDGQVRRWDLRTGRQLWSAPGCVRAPCREELVTLTISTDGRTIATGGAKDGRLLDSESGRMVGPLQGGGYILTARFNPADTRVLASGRNGVLSVADRRGRVVQQMEHGGGVIFDASWSADGNRVITAGEDGRAVIWVVGRTDPQAVLPAPQGSGEVLSAVLNRVGSIAVTGHRDGVVRVWGDDGALRRELRGFTGQVQQVRLTPDEAQVIASSQDGTVRAWRLSDGRRLARFSGATASVIDLAISPDGRRFVASANDGFSRIYPIESGG